MTGDNDVFTDCRNTTMTESSVKQPRVTAVTDDEELRQKSENVNRQRKSL